MLLVNLFGLQTCPMKEKNENFIAMNLQSVCLREGFPSRIM